MKVYVFWNCYDDEGNTVTAITLADTVQDAMNNIYNSIDSLHFPDDVDMAECDAWHGKVITN